MATRHPAGPELKSFVTTQLLFTRLEESKALDALEFLGAVGPGDAEVPVGEPAELVGIQQYGNTPPHTAAVPVGERLSSSLQSYAHGFKSRRRLVSDHRRKNLPL